MQRYIVDRIEGEFAVCEDSNKNLHNIELCTLPEHVSEGDSIVFDGQRYSIDSDDTAKRRARIQKKMNSLFTD